MNATRIKYLDMDACPSVAFSMMLVVGIFCMGIPLGIWWLGCLLFKWLGWESFYGVFHLVGFVAAFFCAFGLTCGAKNSGVSASYGALFLDAAAMAVVCLFVHGSLWTLWTLAALVGLAIHLVGNAPAAKAAREESDRKESEKSLEEMAESLVAKGIDPAEVQKAVDEIRAGTDGGEGVAWSRLMMKFQKEIAAAAEKERLEEERREARRAARARAERAARAAAEEEERRRQEEEEEREKASVSHWAVRLAEHPEEAWDFNGWSDFSPEDWIFLLPKQPQFAKRCRWDELPEDAADRIVARCPKLHQYKVWDETYEDEEGREQTIHHDRAASERGIEALGSASFWKAFAAQQNTESNGDGGDF